MCGIVGIADLTGGRPDYDVIGRAMRDTLTHRGPDEEGEGQDGPVGLGSRRLSIIDVAGGHMPMGNDNRKLLWTLFAFQTWREHWAA